MIFGFPTLRGSESAAPPETDPFFADVVLLLKMDGSTGSKTMLDSSAFADHKTAPSFAGRSIEIREGLGPEGGGVYYSDILSPSVSWSGTKFRKQTGKGFTIEGKFKILSSFASSTAPPLFALVNTTTGLRVTELSVNSSTNTAVARFDQGAIPGDDINGFVFEPYTPDANGWVYYCMTTTAAGRSRIWVNLSLVHDTGASSGGFVVPTNTGQILFCGTTPSASFTMAFYHGEFRVTAEDRYPSGPTVIPGLFPTS